MSCEVSPVEFEVKRQRTTKTFYDLSLMCLHVFQCAFACFVSFLVSKFVGLDPKTKISMFKVLMSAYNSNQVPRRVLEENHITMAETSRQCQMMVSHLGKHSRRNRHRCPLLGLRLAYYLTSLYSQDKISGILEHFTTSTLRFT